MSARPFVLWIVPLLFCLSLSAQTRVVRGMVTDESGSPLAGVKITALTGEETLSGSDGRFFLTVSFQCRFLSFAFPYYLDASAEVDGAFILLRMKYDKEAKAREEQEAREAEEQARREAEARALEEERLRKSEEEAKAKAEKERLAAEEKARKEAEAKALEEERARQAAAKAKADAERKAILAAAQAERARQAAEANARRKADNKAKEEVYDAQYRNNGLEHSLDVSYAYPLRAGYVAYVYSGFRQYGSLHPLELDYTLSWRFNRLVSLGAGVGVLYHLKSTVIINDDYLPAYGTFRERRLDVPVFASLKLNLLRTRIRPLIAIQGGWYCLSGVWYAEAGLGGEFRLGKTLALHLLVSARTTPWPDFREDLVSASYVAAIAPCVKVGVSF